MSNFRINSTMFFFTYARCNKGKDVLRDFLKGLCPHWNYILTAEEKHEDGAPHLHAVLQLKQRKDVVNPRHFDLAGFHPKIEHVRDLSASIDYCKKEGNFLEEGIAKIPSKKKQKMTAKEMLESEPLTLIENNLISPFQLNNFLANQKTYFELKGTDKVRATGVLPPFWDDQEIEIKQGKQRHYWIYSREPNKGKTTFLQKLRTSYPCGDYSCKETFQNFGDWVQLVLFDEFAKGNSIKITDLNSMCDGTYQYPRKGKTAIFLKDPTLIICSNFPLLEVYPNSAGRLEARFNIICLDNSNFI